MNLLVSAAFGYLLGESGGGIRTILDMVTLTRLDCALGTSGLMRQALSIALNHTQQRQAFGKPLIEQPLMRNVLADLAASTQAAIVEVLVKKSMSALVQTGLGRLVVAGGVGANRLLREQLDLACARQQTRVHYPELHLCTDNGAMIAMAAAMRLQSGQQTASAVYAFDVKPRWPLDML